MNKFLIMLLTLIFAIAITGCGKQDAGNTDFENFNTQTTQTTENSIGSTTTKPNSNNDSPFGNFVPDLEQEDVETYDDIPEAIIGSFIEEFKLEHIENFDDADLTKIDNFTKAELQAIATTKANLLNKLTIAFKNAGINVAINETSGEISLDSSVLFGGDSATLSSKGKDFLKRFITTYSSVVLSDEFDGFISKILVEGHTAPVSGGTYEGGLPLSKERANKVKDYCLSAEIGITSNDIAQLASTLEAVGMSNSKPVKDLSGKVDMAASRRVSFRFLINLDKK